MVKVRESSGAYFSPPRLLDRRYSKMPSKVGGEVGLVVSEEAVERSREIMIYPDPKVDIRSVRIMGVYYK